MKRGQSPLSFTRAAGSIRTGLATIALTAVAAGCTAAANEPAPGTDETQTARSPDAVIEATAAAYRRAAAVEDAARLTVVTPQGPEQIDVTYAFGAGTDGAVRMYGLSAAAVGDRVFVTRDDVPDKYLDVALTENLGRTLAAVIPGFTLPVPFAMRAGSGPEAYLERLGLGVLRNGRLDGYARVKTDDGRDVHQVSIAADNGDSTVQIDAKTNLLHRIAVKAEMPGAPQPLSAEFLFAPRVHASPAGVVTFDPGQRRRVDSFASLVPTPVAVGAEAPDFALETNDGRTVALSDLEGKVVVLDFWATWCVPCRMALPLLQQFDEHVRASGQPVEVFAVDTFERTPTAEAMRSQAQRYWEANDFTMSNLIDVDSKVATAFGFQSIPTTVIIDPEGRVAKIHAGFNRNMVEQLKRDVEDVLGGS